MLTCPDFVNEEGSLQHVAKMLGVMVMLTPKCHPEMAGEGVEYAWAGAKNAYRNLALKDKKGINNFRKSDKSGLSDKVLSVQKIRKFGQRQRYFLIAYHAVDSSQADQQTQDKCNKYGPIALEKLMKDFKTYRCALDFASKFIKVVMNEHKQHKNAKILFLYTIRTVPYVLYF